MKRYLLCTGILVFLALAGLVFAAETDIEKHQSCPYCGMNRTKYAHSRMLVEYDDGSSTGLCSLRCAAVELVNNLDKTPTRIGVGDYATHKMLDAEKAVWVIGGGKPGVMTAKPKWAFADSGGADRFVKENGGTVGSFEAAMKAAYEDIYRDTRAIRERRKARRLRQ